ncbi:carbohydrate ABC transporter substrate-binding protein [Phyllobacterium sp. 0TCS1.6C]|uniref:carbohydrate ABC transporter substrate-binding protein n=1 Tax=unclassified Phyllobacterium TaxID=2638441 RepID=UPI002264B0DA|nr:MULTISPECIES: carbohydrate ABC transporter substrate-binding protein [unclassified Phyllobacterium]MCX8279017.1 carbohydrate ABC transporter substrate-binding protein [Phyllobacterium sp. 0TCS1.6C]MCX8293801.1 carbohydrate ABC transporter substrate-binding protein [Phyllobacterium sp. 0TCS1.6A]
MYWLKPDMRPTKSKRWSDRALLFRAASEMQAVKALTWDHPRGYNALAAAAKLPIVNNSGLDILWQKQPLEGFESHPIADLCARYDLVVLDHPHVGEAISSNCLHSLEEVFGAQTIAELGEVSIGPSLTSYRFGGKHWALPLDAATQVMALRPDIADDIPVTWDEVLRLSQRSGKVALSLAGPHACLSFLSIAAAHGEPPAEADPDILVSETVGRQVYGLMAELAARSPASVRQMNPIGLLGHMGQNEDVALCPLVYGYVNYAAPQSGRTIMFHNAPRAAVGGRPGSTLGGTGIGISRRCSVTPQLKSHLLWLMGHEAQSRFIPDHDGQPSRRDVWHDDRVNRQWADFYRNTADTLEQAYVRPRHDGYIAFQGKASAMLGAAFDERRPAPAVLNELQSLYAASRVRGGER